MDLALLPHVISLMADRDIPMANGEVDARVYYILRNLPLLFDFDKRIQEDDSMVLCLQD